MEPVFIAIYNWATSQGIGVLLLVFAIWWLNKQNRKEAAKVKYALAIAQEERDKRLLLMEQSIVTLNSRINDCEADRQTLWGKIVELAKQQGHNSARIETLKEKTQ